jgi:hemin uptake protein HemP
MKAHFIRETAEGTGISRQGWVRVGRSDIEALGLDITSASRCDDEYIYLMYRDGPPPWSERRSLTAPTDAQTFYTRMIEDGRYSESETPMGGRDRVWIDDDAQTFEIVDGLSAVRDLEPVG